MNVQTEDPNPIIQTCTPVDSGSSSTSKLLLPMIYDDIGCVFLHGPLVGTLPTLKIPLGQCLQAEAHLQGCVFNWMIAVFHLIAVAAL